MEAEKRIELLWQTLQNRKANEENLSFVNDMVPGSLRISGTVHGQTEHLEGIPQGVACDVLNVLKEHFKQRIDKQNKVIEDLLKEA